ncbi:60S ribosomal protein L10-like [Cebus imitator]|uniref:60S ribosomal protein L10-like n=1 Tax=Cebus imitator TaxID=2715852 RepID=UPI001898E179|nr:60S ribosomal protein L10-like [Cebus imitator]
MYNLYDNEYIFLQRTIPLLPSGSQAQMSSIFTHSVLLSLKGKRKKKKDGFHIQVRLYPFHVIHINKMLSCAEADRLQTGMRDAFGKPHGTVAGVHTGQVIMSIGTKLQNKEHVIEALHRVKFKFPGHQKIHISKKWGFTKFNAGESEDMVAEKWLIPDGCGAKYIPNHGPLDKRQALHS